MKTTLLALVLALTGSALWAQTPPGLPSHRPLPSPVKPAPATAVKPAPAEEMIPAGTIDFESADVNQVLDVYAKLVNRTLLRPADLKGGQIVLKTQTPLTKTQLIEALQAVLALNGIAVVNMGDKFVKVVPVDQANSAGAAFNDENATNLPDLGSYVTRIVQLKYVKPSEMVPILQPFAKLANSILPIDSNGILVLRDYAENVKRMMEMIARVDINVPDEYVSEVIPIRYAKAADIANVLNGLGSGGSTISFGASSSSSRISGIHGGTSGSSGFNGMNNNNNAGGMAQTMSVNGTPTTGTTFQDRLRSIVQRASGGGSGGASKDKIEIFGQTKIVADERSNSLLVFATKSDLARIQEVVGKLDVLLPQVLIESIIMDVGLGTAKNLGVSAQQRPKQLGSSDVIGGGAVNNGQGFANFVRSALATNGAGNVISGITSSLGTNALASGLSYFGSIGDTWDIAVQAAENDNNSTIIQRPRIQTLQGVPAQFFVGQTVPYVNNTYNNYTTGGYGGSSYSQLSVGVELDVTPIINPDGLVDMQIQQEIDDISGYTTIDGNQVPNTDKRTLNTEIAVRNRETVILGGFIRADKSNTKSGVPLLMDIPLLGRLFSSSSDSKNRTELMVLIRPTVLKTPKIAAEQTIREAQLMPGVSAAAAADAEDERRLIDAERKKELKRARSGKPADGFFNMNPDRLGTNMDSTGFGAAPDNTMKTPASAPVQAAPPMTSQDKAQAALEQKMNELNQAEPAAPPQ